MDKLPVVPGHYCWDEETELWLRFDNLIDAYYFRVQSDPPCEMRIVTDPVEDGRI